MHTFLIPFYFPLGNFFKSTEIFVCETQFLKSSSALLLQSQGSVTGDYTCLIF
jgi:hypothetical protein